MQYATIKQVQLTDASIVYNVELKAGDSLITIGAIDYQSARTIASSINHGAAFVQNEGIIEEEGQ